jgi:hypothetical protein
MQTKESKMDAPAGLKEHGRGLWDAVTREFELNGPEIELLALACRTIDRIDTLNGVVAAEGELITSRFDEPRIHPALIEARNQQQLLGRLLAVLRLPVGGDESERTQARGPRGWYKGTAA